MDFESAMQTFAEAWAAANASKGIPYPLTTPGHGEVAKSGTRTEQAVSKCFIHFSCPR